MNILNNVRVKGEVFAKYAYLTYDYEFKCHGGSFATEYLLPMPGNAVLAGMRIITDDKHVIETSVVPVAHMIKLRDEEKKNMACLRKTSDGSCILSLDEVIHDCRVKLSLYLPLKDIDKNVDRLIIPLKGCIGQGDTKAYISLNVSGGKEYIITSPTHTIDKEETDWGVNVKTKVLPDRDFCLEIQNIKRKNAGVAYFDGIRGHMLCRVYPPEELLKDKFKPFKKILFIIDESGSLNGGADGIAREFTARAIKYCNKFKIIGVSDKLRHITKDFTCYEEFSDKIYSSLAPKFLDGGGSFAAGIRKAVKYAGEDTLPILVCGEKLTEGDIAVDAIWDVFKDKGLCTVTFGAYALNGHGKKIAQMCGGRNRCIYEKDNIEETAKSVTEEFLSINRLNISAECVFGCGTVVKQPEYIGDSADIIFPFTDDFSALSDEGQKGKFSVKLRLKCHDKQKETVVEGINTYKSLAPIQIMYGDVLCDELYKKLENCDADTVRDVKRAIERVGVQYSAINSETCFAAVTDGKRSGCVKVITGENMPYKDVFEGKKSMFKDSGEETIIPSVNDCLKYIACSMRSDGAICSPGEMDDKIRTTQTYMSMLVLSAYNVIDGDSGYFKAADDFVKGKIPKEYKDIKAPEDAIKEIKKYIKDKPKYAGGKLDFYTALAVASEEAVKRKA